MDIEYRYKLETGSKKRICPDCNKKSFVLYVDTESGVNLPLNFGRCDRESKCGYFCMPPLETLCFFVKFDTIKNITEKAVLIQQNGVEQVLPKKSILEQTETGAYVAEYFLNDKGSKQKTPLKILFDCNDKKYFQENNVSFKPSIKKAIQQPIIKPIFFDFNTFEKTLQYNRYEKNTFIQNLLYNIQFPFEGNCISKTIELYRLGTVTNGYRAGANTFPFIDIDGNVRAIQVKQFNNDNKTISTDFLHSIIEKHHTQNNKQLPKWLEAYNKQDKRITCLFGEHLLSKYPNNPVALVEAPKTAVYGTLYFGLPETSESLLWLAVYNKSSFSFDKLKVLQGRFVYVFPDLSKEGNTFKEWESKAKEYESRLSVTRFIFSDLLEQLAPENDKKQGYDIADYLIRHDWRLFRKKQIIEQRLLKTKISEASVQSEAPKTKIFSDLVHLPKTTTYLFTKHNKTENWDCEISELENYFASIVLPTKPLKMNNCSLIKNCSLFIQSHFAYVKANNGNAAFLPYLNRLQELKQILSTQ